MKNSHHDPSDFSIVLGGPLFQFLMRLRLTNVNLDFLKKRIIYITLFAWLPLYLLSLFEGKALSTVKIPFLLDMEAQTRFLIALPLMIAAEVLVHKQVRLLVEQFIERDIITNKILPDFKKLIISTIKIRNSMIIELILLLFAFFSGYYLWNQVSVMETVASDAGSWYATHDGSSLTLAGYWYTFISRPLFQFITYRWYFRIFVWALFLWRSSRLNLNLIPTHPDRACGLGFLAMISFAFTPLIIAHGVLFAGLIANSIFFVGARLTDFIFLILSLVLFILLIVLGPLFAFSSSLMRAKRAGLRDYGVLASRYVEEFDLKWMHHADKEQLIGSSDIQSLADLSNSFQVVREVRSFPFDKGSVIQVIFFVLMPILPLVSTMIPLTDLVRIFFEVIF